MIYDFLCSLASLNIKRVSRRMIFSRRTKRVPSCARESVFNPLCPTSACLPVTPDVRWIVKGGVDRKLSLAASSCRFQVWSVSCLFLELFRFGFSKMIAFRDMVMSVLTAEKIPVTGLPYLLVFFSTYPNKKAYVDV
jgi:hypothetical protein